MSGKAAPMPQPREPNGIIQHEDTLSPPSRWLRPGSAPCAVKLFRLPARFHERDRSPKM